MVLTVISWTVMFIVFWGIGIGISKLISRLYKYDITSMHGILMLGIVFCTVYAEAFSIFYRIRTEAFVILCFIMLAFLVYAGGEAYDIICLYRKNIIAGKSKYICLAALLLGLLVLASYFSSRAPVGFDALNYHIPDIRWLEEYGAVKGIGNLSPWLAYNSSFHCLQALFSFVWLGGTSMHSMNGFIWLFGVMYAAATFFVFSERNFGLSDVLRVIFIKIMFGCLLLGLNEPLAAPGTDLMPMCLVGYLLIEWCSFNESEEKSEIPYGLLSILGFFAASVKLSAAILFIMVLRPLIGLAVKRKSIYIYRFVLIGAIVIIPYLIRSIILSGYLVYPVAGLDLFNFDWEMPKSVVVTDNTWIKMFARLAGAKHTYYNIKDSFAVWFKVWMSRNYVQYSILAITDIIMAFLTLCIVSVITVKKRRGTYDRMIYVGVSIGFLFTLYSAPSLRFGIVWFYFMPIVCIYSVLDYFISDGGMGGFIRVCGKVSRTPGFIAGAALVLLISGIHFFLLANEYGMDDKIVPAEYAYSADDESIYEISGLGFYYTNSDEGKQRTADGYEGLLGYYGFPGSCNLASLKKIELRGDGLNDGFRVKQEYKDTPYDHSGKILDPDELRVLGLDRYY